jgi:ATP synthase protein I
MSAPREPGNGNRRGEARRLESRIDRKVQRLQRAEQERRSVIGETAYLGTLGVLLVLPVIVGAYLGQWLDERLQGYAVHWTTSLIIVGVVIGAVNVYLFIRE